jgi:CHAD domain-containing protein
MAEGKWIHGLTPDTPLARAARHTLLLRLEVVRDGLPQAALGADEETEHVHQLRVGTRRAGAALDLFRVCLPKKTYQKARKRLRGLRRAAGDARDWDVFLDDVAEREKSADARHRPGLDFLVGYALGERRQAQKRLVEVSPDPPLEFDKSLMNVVARVRKPRHGPARGRLIDLARSTLSALLTDLEEAASQKLNDYGHLHRVRIQGKRLRYAMEVFADCFPPAFKDDLYPAVESMQEILGRANDSHVAIERLEAVRLQIRARRPGDWKRWRTGFEGLLAFHEERLVGQRELVLQWLHNWQDGGVGSKLAGLVRDERHC